MDPLSLNIDIANHDASRPVLPDGQYEGVIAAVTVVPSKQNPANHNLLIEVKTTTDNTSTKGTIMAPGVTIKRWFPLQASEKQISIGMENSWKDQIAVLVDGLFGTKQGERPALNQELITQMMGKEILFATKVRKDTEYGDGNELGRMTAIS